MIQNIPSSLIIIKQSKTNVLGIKTERIFGSLSPERIQTEVLVSKLNRTSLKFVRFFNLTAAVTVTGQ